ncbi:MAG: tRNA pseudouridine(13) synthase TruD [Chromatiales bacterium]|nr:tRNA pseudouridine(13) synthase TruD [Chromatiales bacterium]
MTVAQYPQFTHQLAYAHGEPTATGRIRVEPSDFQVDERLGFSPTGSGEHVWLHIEKTNSNTQWVAKTLARAADITSRDVGYSGMKDRHAVTRQWFSMYLPGTPSPSLRDLAPELKVMTVTRSAKKLRRGAHRFNGFIICIREVEGARPALEHRLQLIREHGVPNYFGEQRFGHSHANLSDADKFFAGHLRLGRGARRGIVISAARSWMFNQVLHQRVVSGAWQSGLVGEWPSTRGASTGPLWGRGMQLADGLPAAIEGAVAERYQSWATGLESLGMHLERRPLVCMPEDFTFRLHGSDLTLSFSLRKGEFATALLRELVSVTQ